jgi:hypothetical protein
MPRVKEAEDSFVTEGYQPRSVARSESKRGTSDPTYGYYTMGKLMILKLRDDYKAKAGSQNSRPLLLPVFRLFASTPAVRACGHLHDWYCRLK